MKKNKHGFMPKQEIMIGNIPFTIIQTDENWVKCITSRCIKDGAFDSKNRNNFAESGIRKFLNGEFLQELIKEGVPEDSNKNIEKVDNEEKLYNFVFLEHQREGYGKKYLFQCPLNIKLKKGQDVACETKYGGTNGICVTDSFIVSENTAKIILRECGGYFPPKNITGTAKIETKKVYVPF